MPRSSNLISAAETAPARDGNIAVQEELEAARKARTVEAYELFLARHPRHPLSDTARHELERIQGTKTQDKK
jgi:hypothetical protein